MMNIAGSFPCYSQNNSMEFWYLIGIYDEAHRKFAFYFLTVQSRYFLRVIRAMCIHQK